MITIHTDNLGDVSFSESRAELGHDPQSIVDDPQAQIANLEMLLGEAVQVQADLNLAMTNMQIKHENDMAGMVPNADNDVGASLMKTIIDAMDYMNKRQDENAYRELEDAKIKHGELYGYKEIDPLSPEALMFG